MAWYPLSLPLFSRQKAPHLSGAFDALDEREEEHDPREEQTETKAPVGQSDAVVNVVDLLQDEIAARKKK